MKKREFTAVYVKQGRMFAAWLEEVPGVNAQGTTIREAKKNLEEALTMFLEESRKVSALKAYSAERHILSVPAIV